MAFKEKTLKEGTMQDTEYSSDDFLLLTFSLLESKGYIGFLELQSIVDDAEILLKILRLMAGMNIRIPSLSDFSLSLKTCTYIYYMLIRETTSEKVTREILQLTKEEEQQYIEEFKKWYKHILQQGYDIEDFVRIKKKNTKLKSSMEKIKNEFKRELRNSTKRK